MIVVSNRYQWCVIVGVCRVILELETLLLIIPAKESILYETGIIETAMKTGIDQGVNGIETD